MMIKPLRPLRRPSRRISPLALWGIPLAALVLVLVQMGGRSGSAGVPDAELLQTPLVPPSAANPDAALSPDADAEAVPPPPERVAFEAAPPESGEGRTYVVQEGDTLSSIADAHGVTVAALRAENEIDGDQIIVGSRLDIPEPTRPLPGEGVPAGWYKVVDGDTMWGIANDFGLTVDELLAANPDVNPELIRPGDLLYIPPAG
ncbi:LysM peptidoglycan-binding domain-containing protein [bacterium]|nr:LysM peptidoglycan-binding domain-containing protein [bacterium]